MATKIDSRALRISPDMALPLDAITDTIGILAVKGSGKSYTFMVMAEEMVRSGAPVIIIDVVGVCWGLRTSADGKGEGLPIAVLGGEHADLPLDTNAGRVLAEFAAAERRSLVLDVSSFETKADQIRGRSRARRSAIARATSRAAAGSQTSAATFGRSN